MEGRQAAGQQTGSEAHKHAISHSFQNKYTDSQKVPALYLCELTTIQNTHTHTHGVLMNPTWLQDPDFCGWSGSEAKTSTRRPFEVKYFCVQNPAAEKLIHSWGNRDRGLDGLNKTFITVQGGGRGGWLAYKNAGAATPETAVRVQTPVCASGNKSTLLKLWENKYSWEYFSKSGTWYVD